MGNHERLNPLLKDFLKKILIQTGCPAGAIFLPCEGKPNDPDCVQLTLSIGNRTLRTRENELFNFTNQSSFNASLPAILFHDSESPYPSTSTLEIPDGGFIVLFSKESNPISESSLLWLQPVLGNLARSIQFCRLNEEKYHRVEKDRDLAIQDLNRFRQALDSSPDYFILVDPDSMMLLDYNRSVENNLGYSREEISELKITGLINLSHGEWKEFFKRAFTEEADGFSFDKFLIKKDGSSIQVNIRLSIFREGHWKSIIILSIRDITLQKQIEKTLQWQADHDPLTGLLNRRKFEAELERILEESTRQNKSIFILYMDLDRFKVINDLAGHLAGDEYLRQISFGIQRCLPDGATLARPGSDEFGTILTGMNMEQCMQVAERIRSHVSGHPFVHGDRTIQVGISIGLVPVEDPRLSLSRLISITDMACFAAKEEGRNRIQVLRGNEESYLKQTDKFERYTKLRNAMEQDLFILFGQPIEPLKRSQNHKNHHEILLRLKDQNHNQILGPEMFLHVADEFDLMGEIDRYVIQKSIESIARHFRHTETIYFINLSGDSINNGNLPEFIKFCLKDSRLPPKKIGFEVTENSAIESLGNTTELMLELKHLGIQFALDDFGTGFSSFSYLKKLPLDLIKIDGSFIENIETDAVDLGMVESINHIGHMMNLQIVAEYVKNTEILNRVKELGIDYAQGFAVGEPLPLL